MTFDSLLFSALVKIFFCHKIAPNFFFRWFINRDFSCMMCMQAHFFEGVYLIYASFSQLIHMVSPPFFPTTNSTTTTTSLPYRKKNSMKGKNVSKIYYGHRSHKRYWLCVCVRKKWARNSIWQTNNSSISLSAPFN